MSTIIKLTAENVKRLQAVQITPKGNVIVLGGKNDAGKSSVLDSIEYALGGEPKDPMPVRRGQHKARVVVDLGDLVVKRTLTSNGGGALTITDSEGVKQSSPQSILDKLTGKLTFDPLAFQLEKPEKKAEILRQLAGLDFSELDKSAKVTYDQRAALNREAAAAKARFSTMQAFPDAPEAERPTGEVLAEQQAAAQVNLKNQQIRNLGIRAKNDVDLAEEATWRIKATVADLDNRIRALETTRKEATEQLSAREACLNDAKAKLAQAQASIDQLQDQDLSTYAQRLAAVEEQNRQVRANRERAEHVRRYRERSEAAEALTRELENLESQKQDRINQAHFPIEGLGFDGAGRVTMRGIPLEQCSSSDQLKISVAMGLALNPSLRVLLVRQGAYLDDDNLKVLVDMATAAKAQVWLERVGVDRHTSVIIEDGTAREVPAIEEAAQPEATT